MSEVLQGNADKLGQGSWVYTDQGVAADQGFNHVSKFWYPQTIGYDDAIEVIETQRKNREDIEFDAKSVQFHATDKGVQFEIAGRNFSPTKWSSRQLCNWFGVPQTIWTYYMEGENRDSGDIEIVLKAFENGKRKRYEKPKPLLFRTYTDGTIRGVMSQKYSTVDNVWYLELMKQFIPGGRCSHWRGDADTIFGNILIPDTIREESDSDYGGMLSVSNCEIGRRIVSQIPSIFRAICMNGCIWGQTKGVELKKRHRGLDLDDLKGMIRDNIHRQIPLLTTASTKLIETHKLKAESKVVAIFAALAKKNNFTVEIAQQFQSEWMTHSNENTAFGVIDAVTRAGQKFDNDVWVHCDTLAGAIVNDGEAGWNRLDGFAKSLSEKEVLKAFGIAV